MVNTYLKPFATPHSYVCVCAGRKIVVGAFAEYRDHAAPDLFTPLRLRGARLHFQTNTCHVDFAGSLGRKKVTSKP